MSSWRTMSSVDVDQSVRPRMKSSRFIASAPATLDSVPPAVTDCRPALVKAPASLTVMMWPSAYGPVALTQWQSCEPASHACWQWPNSWPPTVASHPTNTSSGARNTRSQMPLLLGSVRKSPYSWSNPRPYRPNSDWKFRWVAKLCGAESHTNVRGGWVWIGAGAGVCAAVVPAVMQSNATATRAWLILIVNKYRIRDVPDTIHEDVTMAPWTRRDWLKTAASMGGAALLPNVTGVLG